MNPTAPVDPAQQIDQEFRSGVLVVEVVHNFPPDGGGVRRWIDNQGQEQSEQVSGLPVPQPAPKTAAEIAAEHATIETIADMEAFRQALEGSV